jgi:hypothetical protein
VLDAACAAAGFAPRAAVRTEQAPSALNLARAGLGITLLPGNVVPPAFDGVLGRPDPPVQRMLSAYTRVRPDPITAAFVQAICHDTMATPTHILSRLEPRPLGAPAHPVNEVIPGNAVRPEDFRSEVQINGIGQNSKGRAEPDLTRLARINDWPLALSDGGYERGAPGRTMAG